MIWLNPRRVTFDGTELGHVRTVVLDRKAERVVVEWSDTGSHVAFADVPEQRVTIALTRTVVEEGAGEIRPGDAGMLSFRTSPSASDAQVREIEAGVVVTAVEHEVSAKTGAMQRISFIAVSEDGESDPVVESVVGA